MTTILDIGCNDLAGYRLLNKYEHITDDNRKIFVEVNPECWTDLHEALKDIPNSTLIERGVSMNGEDATLVTRADELKCTGATIMGDDFFRDSLNRWGIVAESNYYQIKTTTLENIIKDYSIDTNDCILKLDAEGIEYDLLRWIIDSNIKFKKIYCEFHVHNADDQARKSLLLNDLNAGGYIVIEWH